MARKLTTRSSWQGARGAEGLPLLLLLQTGKRHIIINDIPALTSTIKAIGRHAMSKGPIRSRVMYAQRGRPTAGTSTPGRP